ncbi:MAG: dehydrogenase [Bryobacterales bacterium]|nr:dehydrogenase [Bryobacterales bacterium]
MSQPVRIGVSPDFYTEAKTAFENVIAAKFAGNASVTVERMPPLANLLATPAVLNEYDAIFALALRVAPESLEGVTRPALIARWGVGYDRIDVDAITRAGIALSITPNAVKRPVSEAIFTFILALAKNLRQQDRVTRAGGWRGDLPRLGVSIAGTTLGSIGCGNIAQEMFRMSASMGFARRIAFDPYVRADQAAAVGVELVDLDTVFREADFVTVNTLLNKETLGLIQERHFRLMKPTAYFINTARGPVVEHAALVRALRENWIAGAGIDVYPVEPAPKDDPLFTLDNCIVAPHAMAWTAELMRDNGYEASDNVLALSRGETPGGIVNRAVLERADFQAKLAAWRRS